MTDTDDLLARADRWLTNGHQWTAPDVLVADLAEALRYIVEREIESLARRLAVRAEEIETGREITRRLLTGHQPDLTTSLWWRNSGRSSEPMTTAEHRWLKAAKDPAEILAAVNEELL